MKLELNKKDFINALKVAIIAAAKDDVRYYLKGVFVEACEGDEVNIVATDGHMFARVKLKARVNEPHSYIIDRTAVEHLIKSTPVARDKNPSEITDVIYLNHTPAKDKAPAMLNTQDGHNLMHHALVEGQFPDYRRVLYGKTDGTGEAVQAIGASLDLMNQCVKALKVASSKLNGVHSYATEFNGANGLIVMRPWSIHSCGQLQEVIVALMPTRI